MTAARFEEAPIVANGANAAALIERIRRAIARAQAAPVVAAEESDGDDLLPMRAEVLRALDDAHDVLGAVLARYDIEPDVDDLDFEFADRASTICRAVEARLDDEPKGPEKITSVAFVARIGIRGRRDSVSASTVERKWDLIATCSSAVREVLKSLSAVEMAVAEHEGFSATTRYYVTELDRSLRVRRAYVTFRAEVYGEGPPQVHDAPRRLRSAASALAKLISREAYSFARVHDRSSLRDIQRRIREQLTAHAKAHADPDTEPRWMNVLDLAASRLWQDLSNLSELMLLVNNRAELREHDRKVLWSVRRALEAGDFDAERAHASLAEVVGRDSDVDRWTHHRSTDLAELHAALAHALDTLERTAVEEPEPNGRRATDAPAASDDSGSGRDATS